MLSKADTLYFTMIILCLCTSAGLLPHRIMLLCAPLLIAGPAVVLILAAYRVKLAEAMAVGGNFLRPLAAKQPGPSDT